MNLYFGKISSKKEKEQISEGYYRAVKESSWFNGITPGDYAFVIGGRKIQLWKAREWSKKTGDDILAFDIVHDDLGINTKHLTAFKYFNLTMELAVLTVRSTAKSKKAFFPIFYSSKFTESMLTNKATYQDDSNFRNIHILSSASAINNNSTDVQLITEDGEWKLNKSPFISTDIATAFHDNTPMLGSGQVNKDKTITKVIDPVNKGKRLIPDDLSILQVYDLFCCDYKSKEVATSSDVDVQDEITDDLDIINYDSSNIILYGPPGTGKTFEVLNLIEELDTNEKVGVKIESKGKLDLSKPFWHLAPGRNGYLWNDLKKENFLGYEWCGKEFGDLSKLDSSTDHYEIRKRFSGVKKGDYFCIIRGRQCLGIAVAKYSYDGNKVDQGPFDFQTIEVEWLDKFNTPILLNSSSTMTFSRVGGQRWDDLISGLEEKGFSFDEESTEVPLFKKLYKFSTFHQSYSYEDFVEGIKPKLTDERSDEEDSLNEIEYEIKPGIFYAACDKAAQLAGYSDLQEAVKDRKDKRRTAFAKAQPYYLIIDEINRGNVANIFGELITLIEKDKRLGSDQETLVTLPYSKTDFGVPSNLILVGTMNTADRSIEALDSALRRRFTFLEKSPEPELLENERYKHSEIDLRKLLQTINGRIETLLDKDHLIGHSYFMGIKTLSDIQSAFKNKIIPLLEEYFYGKPQIIGMILGLAFIQEKKEVSFFSEFDSDYSNIAEKKCFNVIIPEDWEAYRSIYAGN